MKELPVGFMNDDHQDFSDMLAEIEKSIADTSLTTIDENLVRLIEHTHAHFIRENEAMEALDHFPPYETHRGEHDRVIRALNMMLQSWQESRDREQLKAGLANLWAWFDIHLETMDTVTAHFIARAS